MRRVNGCAMSVRRAGAALHPADALCYAEHNEGSRREPWTSGFDARSGRLLSKTYTVERPLPDDHQGRSFVLNATMAKTNIANATAKIKPFHVTTASPPFQGVSRPVRRSMSDCSKLCRTIGERVRTLSAPTRGPHNSRSKVWPIEVVAASSPQDSVAEADIVVTAPGSVPPVFNSARIRSGTHINSLGPKYQGRTELPPAMADAAHILVSDFPEQYRSDPDFLWSGTPHMDRLEDLAGFVEGSQPRDSSAITLFLSHGLSGTEVSLLHEPPSVPESWDGAKKYRCSQVHAGHSPAERCALSPL